MTFGKVMSRGQITLPKSIRLSAGISPGDTVAFRLVGEGKLEIRVLPRLSLEEALRRFRIEEPLDDSPWQAYAAGDVIENPPGDARNA